MKTLITLNLKDINPLAFKYYNSEEKVAGKTMEEILRFSVTYWHTFTMDGSDPFGAGNMIRSWDKFKGMDLAKARIEARFEFFEKLNVSFFCFHDIDIAPEGENLQGTYKNLDEIVAIRKDYMTTSKTKLLWNTANMFSHPRFVHGAATAVNADVFAYSAAKLKKGLEVAAVGLKVVQKLIDDKVLDGFIEERYDSYNHGIGKEIVEGTTNFRKLEDYAMQLGEIGNISGRAELLRATINQYLLSVTFK